MIELSLGPVDLAQVRFTTDAIWETTASLHARACRLSADFHRHLPHLEPDEPEYDLSLLLDLCGVNGWAPDFLAPMPTGANEDPLARIAALKDSDPEVVERDQAFLRTQRSDGPATRLDAASLAEQTAAAMAGHWVQVLEPLWDRLQAITTADIAYRTTQAGELGLGPMITELNHRLSWHGDTISVRVDEDARVVSETGGIWFIPSVFRFPGLIMLFEDSVPVISYGARGAGRLWESAPATVSDALAVLLSRGRAAVLVATDLPSTTTELAARVDLSPATVSEHLSALVGGGILRKWRAGRRVLYERTDLGEQLARV